MLLARPAPGRFETVNDADGLIINFWRAVRARPELVAKHAARPFSQIEMAAQHRRIHDAARLGRLVTRLRRSAAFFDAELAGIWAWGMCLQIGTNWQRSETTFGRPCVKPQGLLSLTAADGWLTGIAARLARVRLLCLPWEKTCASKSATTHNGATGIFLDPPYGFESEGRADLYRLESRTVAADVLHWCLERGRDRRLRIALAGYAGTGNEQLEAHGWTVIEWHAHGRYTSANPNRRGLSNAKRERIWFSPGCLPPE